jgi:hypothetical protein
MNIKLFLQQAVLLPRPRQSGVLVVYDPERRYRELCHALASDTLPIVDASESSIESRAAALAGLQLLARSSHHSLADVPSAAYNGCIRYRPVT